MPGIRVHEVAVALEGEWAFRDGTMSWRPEGAWGATCSFDPFPAYAHQADAARQAAAHAERAVPPLWDVNIYLTDREELARTNGHSNLIENHYAEPVTRSGLILLSGKRIPPHPAVTRYLVGHEYGHNVAYMIAALQGAEHRDTTALECEYAAMRGLPESSARHASAGRWHDSAAEILACDFRITVLGAETEFWPHPGITRPEQVPAVREWWDAALAALGKAPREGAEAGTEKPA